VTRDAASDSTDKVRGLRRWQPGYTRWIDAARAAEDDTTDAPAP